MTSAVALALRDKARAAPVIFISIDSLRADQLDPTRENRASFPNLFRLLDRSVWFRPRRPDRRQARRLRRLSPVLAGLRHRCLDHRRAPRPDRRLGQLRGPAARSPGPMEARAEKHPPRARRRPFHPRRLRPIARRHRHAVNLRLHLGHRDDLTPHSRPRAVHLLGRHDRGDRPANAEQKKGAADRVRSAAHITQQRPTLPQSYPCSTIGPGGLYFRVRDGNGCGPSGIAARNLCQPQLAKN